MRGAARGVALKVARRLAIILLVTVAVTAILDRSREMARDKPSGFGRGLIDGALMPGSFPPLLIGRDVTIYAPRNTGRTYKLGYTLGVNACGALFFGIVFVRVKRWRNRRDPGNASLPPGSAPADR